MNRQSQIYYITSAKLKDKSYFQQMCLDTINSYYWSDDWSKEFYIDLARAGFISTTYDTKEGLILLPELQYNYAILDFENLHISKKVKKLMIENSYKFCINSRFNEVLERLCDQHKYNWLKEEYAELLKNLHISNDEKRDFKIISFELVCQNSNELIAGEVGYIIGKTYTSLSGFSSREKKYANYGTLQLVLLAKYLENNNFEFWNLGHPHMEYKHKLGCVTYSRDKFLKRWAKAVEG
jgi:Leu/Phe-tRNA-protein transferase